MKSLLCFCRFRYSWPLTHLWMITLLFFLLFSFQPRGPHLQLHHGSGPWGSPDHRLLLLPHIQVASLTTRSFREIFSFIKFLCIFTLLALTQPRRDSWTLNSTFNDPWGPFPGEGKGGLEKLQPTIGRSQNKSKWSSVQRPSDSQSHLPLTTHNFWNPAHFSVANLLPRTLFHRPMWPFSPFVCILGVSPPPLLRVLIPDQSS